MCETCRVRLCFDTIVFSHIVSSLVHHRRYINKEYNLITISSKTLLETLLNIIIFPTKKCVSYYSDTIVLITS